MKSMNYHTESIFTGHSVYWCLKVYAEKKQALLVTRSCIVSSLHTLAGLLLWTIWKIKDDYIYVYIYIYICVCVYFAYIYIYIYIYFIGMLLWVSYHCIHPAYYLLYIFCLPKINKNRNTKVCSTIRLSKKPPHIENNQPICGAN